MNMSDSEKRTAEPRVTDLDAEEEATAAATVTEGTEEEMGDGSPTSGRSKQNRLEKKSRKALSRLGLKPVAGVVRVTIKKSKHLLLSIVNPEVFKSPTSETYVIFGDAKIDDGHNKAAQAFNQSNFLNVAGIPELSKVVEEKEETSEDIDASGIQEKDIELVMTQGSCSRAKAVVALKENNNDIVEAIMAVSSA